MMSYDYITIKGSDACINDVYADAMKNYQFSNFVNFI